MAPKQTVMTTLVPPLSREQDAALLWLEAHRAQKDAKANADKKLEELLSMMHRSRKDKVIVMDDDGWKHTFEVELGKTKVKHAAVFEAKKTEKVGAAAA